MSSSKEKKSMTLDVDTSIIERNVTIVKDWTLDEDLKNIITNKSPATVVIRPNPGFCIKTKTDREDKKIFINICHTRYIPSPKDLTNEELLKVLHSGKPSSFRIPMSIGEPRIEQDRNAQPTTVYDIAISTKFFDKIMMSNMFRMFFINVVFEGLQNKHKCDIESDGHVMMKNRKCFGNLQLHRIQRSLAEKAYKESSESPSEKKPLIEEISSNGHLVYQEGSQSKSRRAKYVLRAAKDNNELQVVLKRKPKFGDIKLLLAEFTIDKNLRCDDILINVAEDRLIVEIAKTKEFIDVFVPYKIVDGAVAYFDRTTGLVTVELKAEELI